MSSRKARDTRRAKRVAEDSRASSDRRRKLLQLAAGTVFLATVAVAVLIVVNSAGSGSGGDTNLEEVGAVRELLKGIPQEGMVLGDPRATVELTEFGDLQCPVCKGYSEEILPPLIERQVRAGELQIEFRNLTIIGAESTPAGAAALAAGEQGRGWNYLELFYRNQGAEGSGYVTDEFLTAVARKAGVEDLAAWNKARNSARLIRQVEATTAEAEDRYGYHGTPSFVIAGPGSNGVEAIGTPSSTGSFEEAIEEAS